MSESKEATTEELLQEVQREYQKLCVQHGHICAQRMKHEGELQKLDVEFEKSEYALHQLQKKGDQLLAKQEFDQKKAAEIKTEEEKKVSNG